MKPIIVKVDSEGKIKITEEELKRIVDDAYNQGLQDGQQHTITTPYINPVYPAQSPVWYKTDVTCSQRRANDRQIRRHYD